MGLNEKEAAVKLLTHFGFDAEIAKLIGEECNLTVAVFAKNGKDTIDKNKQLMAAAAELGLGYRAVSGDGLFVYLKTKTAAAKPMTEMERQMAALKAEKDALAQRLAAMEARFAPAPQVQEEVVVPMQPAQPNRGNGGSNTQRRPKAAPPPIDEDAHFGD